MNRTALAIVTIQTGKGGLTQHRVQRVENFTTEESIDVDADTFSCQIGDSTRELEAALDRDNEVRISLFIDGPQSRLVPIFTGIADIVQRDTDYIMQISGRDTPSSLAVDTDALPQRWKNLRPTEFLQQRASALGIVTTKIAKKMSPVKTFFSDGSETEWSMWYRLARMRGMYIWTDHLSGGTLYVDKLGYGVTPSYQFGDPPRNQTRNAWIPVQEIIQISTKQGRKRRVIIYGATAKKGKTPGRQIVQQAVDTTIPHWRKKPISVLSSTTAKTIKDLHDVAGVEVFESIVGAVEWQLTIHDTGQLIQQNKMAQVNMPKYMLPGLYFVVGVSRQATPDGFVQIVRLRERGFALSKRIPDAPTLQKTKTSVSDDYKPASSIGAALSANSDIRWADSFVRATREYGGSWDFAVFLGALLSICKEETGFTNIRQLSDRGPNHVEWKPISHFGPPGIVVGSSGETPEGGIVGPEQPANASDVAKQYALTFANDPGNQYNPYAPHNAGVGPMQLTNTDIKAFADRLGWNGVAKSGELDGGRWNPDSNIRAAAKLLVEKAQMNPPADPTNADDIWIAVERYNGSGPKAEAYRRRAQADYNSTFGPAAVAAVSLPKSIPPGSTNTNVNIPNHGVIALPDATPAEARKAIAFTLRHLGDPYVWGGDGTRGYDCSSLVTAALASASPYLKNELDYPRPGNHGETTYTLYRKGRFKDVAKDDLKPGDLVFFDGDPPEHVAMYLGDNLIIDDPHSGGVVHVSGLGEKWFVDHYTGARRVVDWSNTGVDSQPPSAKKATKVMIQAGHTIPSGQSDEPYGHSGETGASGEQDFTTEIRDKTAAAFSVDPRFDAKGGTAWDASAGPTSDPADDINYDGDIFVSVHYSIGTPGSGFFFGYTRGATDGRSTSLSTESAKLADAIATEIAKISGAPSRTADNTGFGGSIPNETGWGYYSWGSDLRSSPNNVDHVPNARAAVIMECGLADDVSYLTNKRVDISYAIYSGICRYLGLKPH